jgi:signal transduction histidine kinase
VNILLVDDQSQNLLALEAVLEELGENLVKARSGRDALRCLLEQDFAVILLDVHMPDMDGFETAALIRERLRSSYTPIIFLTAAHRNENHISRGYSLGGVDYILKPVVPEILRSKVSVFVELARKTELVRHQSELLRAIERREHERLLADTRALLLADLECKNLELEKGRSILEEKVRDLARANEDLEQFAYVASHDLQEPLRMVTMYVQLLARRNQGKLSEGSDDFIRFAQEGAARMHQLIHSLLEYSRIGARAKVFEPVDFEVLFEEVMKNLQVAREESGAVVTHDRMPVVGGDAAQLRTLLQNLIGNAIKFRGAGTPRIHLAAEAGEKEWVFSVKDNGIGIDPEHADRIFVIFQRLHARESYPGTGIGLTICKKIVQRHGGRIWVESEPGKGATFKFTLPMRAEEAEPQRPGGR